MPSPDTWKLGEGKERHRLNRPVGSSGIKRSGSELADPLPLSVRRYRSTNGFPLPISF
jgi:hypothetical protein